MRTRIFCAVLVVGALLISARPAAASFTYNFTEYVNATSNGTSVTTTVAVDGPESMSFYPPGVVHIPYVFNQLSTNGTTVGGWQQGGGFCPNCYISYQNPQQIAIQQGFFVDMQWSAYVDCTLAGIFWNGGGGSEDVPTLSISPSLWFFGLSNNPPSTFQLGNNQAVVSAPGASGGTFAWSITNGGSKVSFASGSQQSATTTSSNTVTVYSIGYSTALNDSTIKLSWTPAAGPQITSSLNLTVDSPGNLVLYSNSSPTGVIACLPPVVANNPIGWWVQYQWKMMSLTGRAMSGINFNEEFFDESDQQNNNWSFTPNGSPGSAGNSILEDDYCLANQLAANPISLPPQNPLLSSSVDSANQNYYVGSQTVGSGVAVQTHILTRYQDHATVTGVQNLRPAPLQ